ncbi:neutral zinc metallopeptidase [Streptomonospora sediminis]
MDPTPGGQGHPAADRPPAPVPPHGAAPSGQVDTASAAYPGSPAPAPGWTAAPQPVDRSPAVWFAVGAAALLAVSAFTISVLLVVLAPPPEGPQGAAPAAADPARFTSKEFSARPSTVEVDLTDHPAYSLAVPEPVPCEVPGLDPESGSSWEGFSATLTDCLAELWRPRLEQLGLRSPEPEFRVSRTDPDSGSGEPGIVLAYYENSRMRITAVLPNVVSLLDDVPDGRQESVAGALLAHEYGHHIQELTGILGVSYAVESEAGSEDARLEALRRTELQAECLAGMAMQGLEGFSDGDVDAVNDILNRGNGLDTHGSVDNRRHWFDKGTAQGRIGACNTYAAPAAQVN